MKQHRGFSLIELLIVVAIILVIAAIAVPNFLKARMAANESSAVANIRSVTAAEISFINSYPLAGYADLPTLGGASPCTASVAQACLIDNALATATVSPGKNGYVYSSTATVNNYVVAGKPDIATISGTKSFCSTNDGVIRVSAVGGAIGSLAACQALPGLS